MFNFSLQAHLLCSFEMNRSFFTNNLKAGKYSTFKEVRQLSFHREFSRRVVKFSRRKSRSCRLRCGQSRATHWASTSGSHCRLKVASSVSASLPDSFRVEDSHGTISHISIAAFRVSKWMQMIGLVADLPGRWLVSQSAMRWGKNVDYFRFSTLEENWVARLKVYFLHSKKVQNCKQFSFTFNMFG